MTDTFQLKQKRNMNLSSIQSDTERISRSINAMHSILGWLKLITFTRDQHKNPYKKKKKKAIWFLESAKKSRHR